MLLSTLAPLLASTTTSVKMELKSSAGGFELIVSPISGVDATTDELILLKAALASPLRIVGALDDIEAVLAKRISDTAPIRNQWETAVERAQEAIAKAKTVTKQSGSKTASGSLKPVAVAENEPIEDVDFEL